MIAMENAVQKEFAELRTSLRDKEEVTRTLVILAQTFKAFQFLQQQAEVVFQDVPRGNGVMNQEIRKHLSDNLPQNKLISLEQLSQLAEWAIIGTGPLAYLQTIPLLLSQGFGELEIIAVPNLKTRKVPVIEEM